MISDNSTKIYPYTERKKFMNNIGFTKIRSFKSLYRNNSEWEFSNKNNTVWNKNRQIYEGQLESIYYL